MKKKLLSLMLAMAMLTALMPLMPVSASDMGKAGVYQTIAAGCNHTAAIKTDGSLWTWGRNEDGRLGDSTTANKYMPIKIMDNVAAVSAGYDHTAAIKTDGSLWTWGSNDYGQLGDGTTKERHAPVKVMENVAAVSAGFWHTAAIKTDGSLWTWGRNEDGQLGDGTTDNKYTPVKIMDNVAVVLAGRLHTAAIKTDGSLWTWGWNAYGQLGDGTTEEKHTPVKIMDNVAAVSAGRWDTAAIKTGGSLWTWGDGRNGELGDGTTGIKHLPVKIMDNVAAVSAGGARTTAIKTDGSLWIWGNNYAGGLGDGTTENKHTPVKIMDNVAAVSAGFSGHTAAIKADGSLWTWGNNDDGQLGNGTTESRSTPTKIMDNVKLPGGGTITPEPTISLYTQQHLNFIQSSEYSDILNERWANIIGEGINTSTGNAGETMYDVLNSAGELMNCKSLSVFDNPYDAIVADLILQEADFSLNDFEMNFNGEFLDYISKIETLCQMSTDDWEANADYSTSLEKLIADPVSVKEENPAFYELCENILGKYYNTEELNDILSLYGKADDIKSAMGNYWNVVDWVSECLKFNAMVSAYKSTSDDFKAMLMLAGGFMDIYSSSDSITNAYYSTQFEAAVKKYLDFMDTENETELFFKAYFEDGMDKIADVFGSALRTQFVSYIGEGLGLSGAALTKALTWAEAVVFAYETGMTLSDVITNNGDIMDCRELIRANYYLEKASAELLDSFQSILEENKDDSSATKFDAAYKLLKRNNIYSLKTYKKYLEVQQSSFVNGLMNKFNWKYNAPEIEIADIEIAKWERTNCHDGSVSLYSLDYDEDSIETFKISGNNDVYIYNSADKLIFSIENGNITCGNGSDGISASILGNMTVIADADAGNHKMKVSSENDTTADVVISSYNKVGETVQSSAYKDVEISSDTPAQCSYSADSGSFCLAYDDTVIEPEYSGTENDFTATESITLSKSGMELNINETAAVSVTVAPADASCTAVSWTSSNNNIATVDSNGKITATGSGNAKIYCTAIDGSGVYQTVDVTVRPIIITINKFEIKSDNIEYSVDVQNSVFNDILIAVYDGSGRLYDLIVNGDLSGAITINGAGDYTMKAFVWNSVGGMTPLVTAAENSLL